MRCPICRGPGIKLGKLGNRVHYRCRNCGMMWSRRQGLKAKLGGSPREKVIARLEEQAAKGDHNARVILAVKYGVGPRAKEHRAAAAPYAGMYRRWLERVGRGGLNDPSVGSGFWMGVAASFVGGALLVGAMALLGRKPVAT